MGKGKTKSTPRSPKNRPRGPKTSPRSPQEDPECMEDGEIAEILEIDEAKRVCSKSQTIKRRAGGGEPLGASQLSELAIYTVLLRIF